MKTFKSIRFFILVLGLFLLAPGWLRAQGTAFTYQGKLNDSGSPANGNYDLEFTLFDAVTNGNQVGGTVTNLGVGVNNGLFTTTMDFGPGIFNGTQYWLQIGVETNGGGGFTLLGGLQSLTPAPYAIYSSNANFSSSAGTATTANGVSAGSVTGAGIASGQVVKSVNGLMDAVTLAAGANVTITPSGNTLTINSAGGGGGPGSGWSLTGNAATTAGTDFLGTIDNQPLELHVNGMRGFRLEPSFGDSQDSVVLNVVGGSPVNFVTGGVFGATISGGGAAVSYGTPGSNSVTGNFGTVGGGIANTATYLATVGGGAYNSAGMNLATVGGGNKNNASGLFATIGGGENNRATIDFTTVCGGFLNTADGQFATIGGGQNNYADGTNAVVAGGFDNTSGAPYSTISGGASNTASGPGAFVGGGGFDGNIFAGNSATGGASTVGGGIGNSATFQATVGGGAFNSAGYQGATVGGGLDNINSALSGTVGGGENNSIGANAYYGTVGGGDQNICNGGHATIPGGENNVAGGTFSFAAGQRAKANHQGAFVWADSQAADFASTGNDQFCIRAQGGVTLSDSTPYLYFGTTTRQMLDLYSTTYGIGVQNSDMYYRSASDFFWYKGGSHNDAFGNAGGGSQLMRLASTGNLTVTGTVTANGVTLSSDRNVKESFKAVDAQAVLEKVAALPVSEWQYKSTPDERHLGPMAQDFRAAFNLGADDKHIAVVDEGGVALAAIQGLNEKLEKRAQKLETDGKEKDAQIQQLQQSVAELKEIVTRLAAAKAR